jgi:hypothetical protein
MPIPIGAKTVRGQPNRVQLDDGTIVTRARALSMGAQHMGYRSNYDYRKNASGDKKYFDAWMRSGQGRYALSQAKERGLTRVQLQQQLIAARNARPHPGSGTPAGSAYIEFQEDYDLIDVDDWVDY